MPDPGLISEALPPQSGKIPGVETAALRRRGRIALPRGLLISTGSSVGILLLWAVLTNLKIIGPDTMPTPQAFAQTFWEFLVHGYGQTSALGNVGVSLMRALTGLSIGLAFGVPVGLLMGYSATFNAVVKPVFSFLRPIPALAFVPLVVLFFGIGETAKIAVIAEAAFLYSVLHSSAGAAAIPENYILLAQNVGLSRLQIFRRVVLPAAAPYVVAGIRTATAIAWAVMVAAELIAAHSGLGYMIMDAATFYKLPFVYVGIVLIGLVGLALETVISVADRTFIHWRAKD